MVLNGFITTSKVKGKFLIHYSALFYIVRIINQPVFEHTV